jgi:hypothetical protein
MDAYEDAAVQAWDVINDALGITDSAEDSVDGAIEKVKEPRLRLLLGFAKGLGKTYAGQLMEDFGGQPDQYAGASFQGLWAEYGNEDGGENSTWADASGATISRPNIDFELLNRGRDYWQQNDPSRIPQFDSQKDEIEKWIVSDLALRIEKDRYLYRGDSYDYHGYEGRIYKGIDVFTGRTRLTAKFTKRLSTPPEPNLTP